MKQLMRESVPKKTLEVRNYWLWIVYCLSYFKYELILRTDDTVHKKFKDQKF